MAKLRVLGENPPPPRGNGENQLRELRDYITRLKDELEYLLTHLGEDNLDDQTLARIREIDNVSGEVDNINTAVDHINGEVENINTALAGKQDTLTFDSVPTSGSDNPVKSSGIFDWLKKIAGRNLLRNWLFIGGGTGHRVFPVNQRGQASYATSGIVFTADGWVKNSAVYVYLQSDCMALARSAAGADNFSQFLDSYSALAGKTCILSLLVKGDSGTRIRLGYSDVGNNTYGSWVSLSSTIQLVTFTFSISAAPTQLRIILCGDWPSTTAKIYLYAAKLELGEEQTLAHLENNAWVLNEVPDYTMELIRCQTCTANADDTYANKTIVVQ